MPKDTIKLTWYDNETDEEVVEEFPSKMEVCFDCEGTGYVLCEGMRGYAYSQEEFTESFDYEEREEYFRRGGRYDVRCPTCRGKNVIPVVNEERLTPEQKKLYASYEEYQERTARYEAEDRATYRMENGGYD